MTKLPFQLKLVAQLMMNAQPLKHAETRSASTHAFLKIHAAQQPDVLLKTIDRHALVPLVPRVIHIGNVFQLKRENVRVILSALITKPVWITIALILVKWTDPVVKMPSARRFRTDQSANVHQTMLAILVLSVTPMSVWSMMTAH